MKDKLYTILILVCLGFMIKSMGTDVFEFFGVCAVGIIVPFFIIGLRRLFKGNGIKNKMAKLKEERRNTVITAKVTKVNNMMWVKKRTYDCDLYCEKVDENGRKYEFKAEGVNAKFKVKEGDLVSVVVETGNWSNYQIILVDIVE